jgi:butyryl-CoA dehydrogenase
LDLTLTEEQLLIQQTTRDFARNEIAPRLPALFEAKVFPRELVKRMGELGFLGMTYPVEYGGGGADWVSYLLAAEELSRVDAGVGNTAGLHNSLVGQPLLKFGTEEQKRRYLPLLASGEMLGCFALTEPQAGSDAAGLEAYARDDGDEWVLNGTKNFITNGSVADFAIVFAKTERGAGHRGISAFLCETAKPGFRVGTIEHKMGMLLSPTSEIVFEDYRLPKENMLGGPGQGFRIAMFTLDGGRVSLGAQCVGIAEAAFDAAVTYARQRVQFGRPIAKFQAIQWKIADMRTEIDAARLLTLRAVQLKEEGRPYSRESAIAKLFASEMVNRVVHHAVQIFGGNGCMEEYPVARLFRDARVTSIYEGTSEIQRLVIAEDIIRNWPG